jgi:hypothetical protein
MLNAKGKKAKCSMLNAESTLEFSLQTLAFVFTPQWTKAVQPESGSAIE